MVEADRIFAAVNAQNLKFMAAVLEIAAERDRLQDINAELVNALEVLVEGPSDDWRDATEDADGHLRTPLQRALKQARAAIAEAREE